MTKTAIVLEPPWKKQREQLDQHFDECGQLPILVEKQDDRVKIGDITTYPLKSEKMSSSWCLIAGDRCESSRQREKESDATVACGMDIGDKVDIKQTELEDTNDESQNEELEAEVPITTTSKLSPGSRSELADFVGRFVREFSFKREINARIARKQLEMKNMLAMVANYRGVLQNAIHQQQKIANELAEKRNVLQKSMKETLYRIATDGFSREHIDTYRCLLLLTLQENKLLRTRTELRQVILQTRCEECQWLCKSIEANFQAESQALSSLLVRNKGLKKKPTDADIQEELNGRMVALISSDDPFFTSPDRLYRSHAQSKQLLLQLTSIAKLLETVKAKLRRLALERQEGDGLAIGAAVFPVSMVKRPSLIEFKTTPAYPSSQRQHEIRQILDELTPLLKVSVSERSGEKVYRIQELLSAFCQLASDKRTRTGKLVAAFSKQLKEELMITAQVRCIEPSEYLPEELMEVEEYEGKRNSDTLNLWLPNVDLQQLQPSLSQDDTSNQCAIHVQSYATTGINVKKLPQPICILAFVRFIQKLIISEYKLDQNTTKLEGDNNQDVHHESDDELDVDTKTLDACVHELVFRRITMICFAYEQSEYVTSSNPEGEIDVEYGSHLENGKRLDSMLEFQRFHWKHSKSVIQQISLDELAFPPYVFQVIQAYDQLKATSWQGRRKVFLPKALQAFQCVESETTPMGIVRAVMRAFTILHKELEQLLTPSDSATTTSDRTIAILNADVLIPSLVLMMSRLPKANNLDLLWRRVLLVNLFRSSMLIDGCEEAYYLTCLEAAMKFIQTFSIDSNQEASSLASLGSSCKQCHARMRSLSIELVNPNEQIPSSAKNRSANTPSLVAPHNTDDEVIRQLSAWISMQASVEYVPMAFQHEDWIHE